MQQIARDRPEAPFSRSSHRLLRPLIGQLTDRDFHAARKQLAVYWLDSTMLGEALQLQAGFNELPSAGARMRKVLRVEHGRPVLCGCAPGPLPGLLASVARDDQLSMRDRSLLVIIGRLDSAAT